MNESSDEQKHMVIFFDAMEKLYDVDVDTNDDLLAIVFLYNLPGTYKNFRCAIDTHDKLPPPETLRIKILKLTKDCKT